MIPRETGLAATHVELAEEPQPPLLQMMNIRKTFPGVVALEDIELTLEKGETHALLGANGAGKSTLIKILAGVHAADNGRIYMNGERTGFEGPLDAQRAGIRVIHQDLSLLENLSIAENIFLGRELRGALGVLDHRRMRKEAMVALQKIGVQLSPETSISDLSMGPRQLVEIAKALVEEVSVLILDEPTASLSEVEASKLFAILRDLANSGVGLIYISHKLEEIAPLADKITVLRDGRRVGTFSADQMSRSKLVSLISGGIKAEALSHVRNVGAELLRVRGLTCPGVFSDIDLSVRSGEITVITGLVGAGRSEVLETLFGSRMASSGQICINGSEVRIRSPKDAVSYGIALIPEDRRANGLCVDTTIEDSICLPNYGKLAGPLGVDRKRCRQAADRQINALMIKAPDAHSKGGTLSGGNQQKVVIAKWMESNARIFLFDEPTQGVDVGAKSEIYHRLNQLAGTGHAILVVSSDLEEVLKLGDRILAMHHGHIVREFERAGATANGIIDAITYGAS
ncbi:sugar ABC transporter ATP-binding protein [Roseibium sediminicola]|uniref:Sugar ABC transporter ATP-binding protein n=1 Tax=Roseibium sediminicola TaxID=2933272 RepID=A0ABT0H230_9HYPH|nr:sugar ABC transporter ATP-binding protein [Roseibium sp. CAU 1639]MCK7615724.1 sugar ABC transporter ATP-binding protein [Roseibium sp. CAU 1639]